MKQAIWQAFRETGDPLCYLLYRALRDKTEYAAGEDTQRSA